MQYSLSLTLMVCAMVFQLLGCSENTDVATVEEVNTTLVETLEAEPISTKITPESVFKRLQNQFVGRLENQGDFIGLRNATSSRTYLDFLAEVYPTEKPVKTLEEYFQIAPPDAERYTPFLKKWIGNPIVEDIAIMHRITVSHREANITLFNIQNLRHGDGIDGKKLAENVLRIFEKKIFVMDEPATKAFLRRHQILMEEFSVALQSFVVATEMEDATWLHEQMEVHGTDLGLLWSAIRKPALIGEILQNFSSTDVFLQWIDKTRRRK